MTLDTSQLEGLLSLKETISSVNIDSPKEAFFFLKKSLEQIIHLCTDKENIQFPTLSSRLIFIVQTFHLPRQLVFEVQKLQMSKSVADDEIDVNKSKRIILIFLTLY